MDALATGFRYAGLQEGTACACGNSYGKYGQLDIDECHVLVILLSFVGMLGEVKCTEQKMKVR